MEVGIVMGVVYILQEMESGRTIFGGEKHVWF